MQTFKNAATVKDITITKTIKKCVDEVCVWRSDKCENGCFKFTDLQTCIDNHGRMTRKEATRLGLI